MEIEMLAQAIENNNLAQIKEILAQEPSFINQVNSEGIPYAFLAAQVGDLALTRHIVEYSMASMNTRDAQYRSILHHAVLSGKVDSIPYLVERVGMSAFDGDQNLITPFDLALEHHFQEIEAYFCSYYHTTYENTYHNPIRTGMFPDPSIIRVGEDYYMVNSTFIFFPCIPVSHSKDLLHWEIIGHAITNPAWAHIDELEGGRGYWAPDISYHDGIFYITATYRLNDTGTVRRRQIVVSSDKPEGPYSEPFYIEEDGIDPSLFHDDDGRSYMLLNRGARILELDLHAGKQISPATLLFYGDQKRAPEGPHLLKKDGWYYLFEAEGGTGEGHRITVSRSRTLMGTYHPCPYNPIMRQWISDAPIQRCGHGKPVMTQNGDWYMVYLCGRQINGKYSMLGRETALDPIIWTADGWPIVNNLQGPSCQQIKPVISTSSMLVGLAEKNCLNQQQDNNSMGNHGFGVNTLSKDFMTPRTPTPNGIHVQDGILTIEGSRLDLHSMHAKNIVVRRQSDFSFTCSVVMDFSSLSAGQDAGMTCYYDENTFLKYGIYKEGKNETDYYKLAVFEKIDTDEHFAFVNDITDEIMTCLSENRKTLHLQITTSYLKRSFSYRFNENEDWQKLVSLDHVYYLCDEGIQKGKRFTGAMIGVYAYAGIQTLEVKFSNFSYHACK